MTGIELSVVAGASFLYGEHVLFLPAAKPSGPRTVRVVVVGVVGRSSLTVLSMNYTSAS